MNVLASVHDILNSLMTGLIELGMPDIISVFSFYLFAFITLFAGVAVIFCKNIVHSALFLTLSFIGVGCLYLRLLADFLGAVQFLLYGGAVAIIIALGIMLTRREDMSVSNPARALKHRLVAFLLSGLFFIMLSASILLTPFDLEVRSFWGDSVSSMANLMLFNYTLAFELIAILLLVALMGAIFLARGEEEK